MVVDVADVVRCRGFCATLLTVFPLGCCPGPARPWPHVTPAQTPARAILQLSRHACAQERRTSAGICAVARAKVNLACLALQAVAVATVVGDMVAVAVVGAATKGAVAMEEAEVRTERAAPVTLAWTAGSLAVRPPHQHIGMAQ